ncbi:MAG: hypothetical protein E6K77_02640 [Candidatus Eisenbacteria bacterium]|uniref:Tyrosine kinase G-rich domain-containing protein n=1 Tax=Eiseniibacteriota bacterium TaxID=2212470 RepID=A0A538TPI7_UNCEI|nr:MAG: hypothetical protein E6K74_01135 [Candidatus Eisenbacteria bacterium]TMQ65547.1 MAG: hypothetical protein E6K77_02640 [Candidatus Eisenbacteria bacterium]
MNLRAYWNVIRRRKGPMLGCILACVALSVALNVFTAPVYRSSARVEISREATRSPLTGAATDAPTPQTDNQALFTTAEMVTSRALLAQVVTSLERQGVRVGPQERERRSAKSQGQEPGDMTDKIDWLLANVIVEPIRDTRLIRISAEHNDAGIAAKITNSIAENLVNYQQGQRSELDTSLGTNLRARADELQKRINSLDEQTRGSMGLFSLEEKIRQLSETVGTLSDSHTKARLQRLSISSQLAQIRSVLRRAQIDPNEIPISNESLDALRRDLIASNTALAKARETYGPSHPKLISLKAENDAIQRNIRQEVSAAVANLSNDQSIAAGREESMQTAITQAEGELRSLNNQAAKYRVIEAELKADRDLYSLLMARVHEVEITSQIKSPLVRIVESAVAEREPVRPHKILNLAIGLLLGLLSGAGLVLLLESYRKTIRTPDEVDRHLQLPVLGLIPKESVQ